MVSKCICCKPAFIRKDKLVGGISLKDSNTFIPSPTIFWVQTATPAQAFTFVSNLPDMYTNVNLQKAIKLTLKLFIKGQKHEKANSTPKNRVF